MKSSKQVLIAVIAVLIMLMPTTALAAAITSTECVGGEGTSTSITVYDFDELLSELGKDENYAITLSNDTGTITANKTIDVVGEHVLSGNITVKRSDAFKDVLFKIGSNASLTMDGISIDGNNVSKCKSLVSVGNGGTFTMNGGTISDNNADNGGAVYVNGGTFTMNGGTISDNNANNGGAVYVAIGTFTMNDNATICGNTASNRGGGVEITGSESSFVMNNGTVCDNVGMNGGGVRIDLDGNFEMNGGTISNNTATSTESKNGNGGGVAVGSASFTMMNGHITNNKAICNGSTGWGAGVFLLTNDSKYGTMFTMFGGDISNNGQSDTGVINGNGRELYLRDVSCITVINGGKILEGTWYETISNQQVTHTYSNDGSSIYMSGSTPVKFNPITNNANPFAIGGNTDDIQGTVHIDPKVIVTILNNINTVTNGLTVSFTNGNVVMNKVLTASQFSNYSSTFNVITIDTETDVYIDCTNGDDNNNGDFDNPVKTLKKAFELLSPADVSGKSVAIHVLNGPITIESGHRIAIDNRTASFDDDDDVIIRASNITIVKAYIGQLFSVDGELSLDHVILNGANYGGALINANGTVTINADAELTQNNDSGAIINNGATVTLEGKITKCKTPSAVSGGAFFMNGGSLTMNGGEISGCGAKYGAAVRMESSNCVFIMNDGKITGNTAYDNGSAVSAKYFSSFTMNGGEISGNINGENGMTTPDAELLSAIQMLYGATFTINGGIIADNTGPHNYQIYAQRNGIININGGIIRDIENVCSIFVTCKAENNKYVSININSGYDGKISVVNSRNTTQNIIIENSTVGAGSFSLVYPNVNSGFNVNASFEVVKNAGYYLDYQYTDSNGVVKSIEGSSEYNYPYDITQFSTTNSSNITVDWGTFHEVQYEEEWTVEKIHNGSGEPISSGDYVASCDKISVTVTTGTSGGSVYMNGVQGTLEEIDGSMVAIMDVPSSMEMLYIVPDTGALSVEVTGTLETVYGSTPSDIDVIIGIASGSGTIAVANYAITEGFTLNIPQNTTIPSTEKWTVSPSSNLAVGEYTVEIKLYKSTETTQGEVGIVGYASFDYTVIDADMVVEMRCNGEDVNNNGTILYIVGTGTFELEVTADVPMVFVGIDTILPIDAEPTFDEDNNVMTIVFNLDGTATGCFHLDLFVCSESSSVERGLFLNILPEMEFLTEPSA